LFINTIFAPKFNVNSLVYVHTHSPPSIAKIIGIPTHDTPNIYTVTFKDGSISEYTEDFLSLAPDPVENTTSLLLSWVKEGANATLFLESMSNQDMVPYMNPLEIGIYIPEGHRMFFYYLIYQQTVNIY